MWPPAHAVSRRVIYWPNVGCLVLVLALISPRVALFIVWVATNLVERAFDSFVVPLLGLLFLPITTLIYVFVYDQPKGVGTFGWILVGFGVLLDLSSSGSAARRRRT